MGTLGALVGLEVVEFGDFYPAAFCAYHLHLLGAAVTLAEPPEGCELRRLAGRHPRSGLFAFAGRGRRAVSLAAFGDAQSVMDIVLEPAFPTEQTEAALAAHRSRDFTGKTITLSFREADGSQLTELTAQAALGISGFLGRQQDPPLRAGIELVGGCAGLMATQAILAALRLRAATGVGQRIAVPMSRIAGALLNNMITASIAPDQATFFSQGWSQAPAHGLPAADGAVELMFYGPRGERGFPDFCRSLGAEALAADKRFDNHRKRMDDRPGLTQALAPWSRALTRDALVDLARDHGAMVMPIHGVLEAREWRQTLANDMVDGAPGARLPAAPWQLNGLRPTATRGEQT